MKFLRNSDKDLVRALNKGSIAAYEALFARYQDLIRRFIVSVTRDEAAADDLTQDVFMTLWSARGKLDAELPIRSWLYVTSRNKALNWLKASLRRQAEVTEEPVATALAQDYALDLKAAISRLDEELSAMPSRRREVFRMSRIEGKSREEIADCLGIALRTVDKHLEVANRILRKHLKYDA